jgi:hypothetical protein
MTNFKTASALVLFLACSASRSAAQVPSTFTLTGSMTAPRAGHTATLLTNGKVLIAGGSQASAELYNPSTGAFSLIGSMSVPRTFHAAALLPDGKVLIVGGDAGGTAELYDPSTGLFSLVGSMGQTRRSALATVLNNGKVLIAGGPFASLFDPSNATFTSLGPLPIYATALTLLADGKVLIQGTDEAGFAGSAHYDPETGAFRLGGEPMTRPWSIITATLLASGKVLDTSTATDESWPTGVADFYDPSTEAFVSRKMAAFRRWPAATLLPNSTVLITGGGGDISDTWWYSATSGTELYDPVADSFSLTGNMAENRERHTATLLPDGTALIAGGGTAGFGSGSAEIYHPNVLIPAPVLFSLSGNGRGQGAIWHAATGQAASADNPAVAGETLSMYTTNLIEGGVIPPQLAVGGRLAQVLYFGASGYAGYNQVNFRLPNGVASGPAVVLRLTYLGRSSNEVTIGVR